MASWYAQSIPRIFDQLRTGELGLREEEAIRRLKEDGANVLPEKKPDGIVRIFLRQFESSLIYVLLGASLVVFLMGQVVDALIIVAVLIFNAIVGSIQEGKAQNILKALEHLVDTKALVVRDEKEVIVPDSEVVVGDIIALQEGAKVSADARVIFSQNLRVDESMLTGESVPVSKIEGILSGKNRPAADQTNMVFKGTNVVGGSGRAVVVATGAKTVIGDIAKELSSIVTEVPLKANIRRLSRAILLTVLIVGTAIFFYGIAKGYAVRVMFSTVVSLAVSVIPEGLPIVMTLILATGVRRMSKRNALVKELQAVEALGQATVIAVDKTGTITRNEQVIQEVWTNRTVFTVGGIGYEPKGEISVGRMVIDPAENPSLLFAGKIATFCANARALYSEEESRWQVTGDPTEVALAVFGEKVGFHKDHLERAEISIGEIPFDHTIKYHGTLHKVDGKNFLTIVGAPEEILKHSHYIWRGEAHELQKHEKDDIERKVLDMTSRGLRVLAFAVDADASGSMDPKELRKLTFVGLFGMKDALREEVPEAMRRAEEAGIRVVMITGDHVLTARAIAKEAGVYRSGDTILTGHQIDAFSDEELSDHLSHASVFARVSPEHKLRIIQAYKRRGDVIAMTGDGVNDAPSLVAADLGVSMGRMGSEVAKEASDIVLLDDNFGSIVSAVEEGRGMYHSIRKVVFYLFSTSAGEVLTLASALVIGLPLPILAAQVIWLNFVTDGFLDVALAMEPKEEGLLSRAFAKPGRYLVDSAMMGRIVLVAVVMMCGTLYVFAGYVAPDMTRAWTIALTTLAVFQWFNAWNCRSDDKSVFSLNPFTNMYLIAASAVVITLQLFAVYNPIFQRVLHTTALSLSEWGIILGIASSILLVEELRKLLVRARSEHIDTSRNIYLAGRTTLR